jgi:hypothetical protein
MTGSVCCKLESVRSIQFNDAPDDSCWYAGKGWWLSTTAPDGLVNTG